MQDHVFQASLSVPANCMCTPGKQDSCSFRKEMEGRLLYVLGKGEPAQVNRADHYTCGCFSKFSPPKKYVSMSVKSHKELNYAVQ